MTNNNVCYNFECPYNIKKKCEHAGVIHVRYCPDFESEWSAEE